MQSARRIAPLLILLAGIVAYSNSFSVPFQFDDWYFIVDPRAHRFFEPLWKSFIPPPHFQPWVHRPLVTLTLAMNYNLGGLNPWGYHAGNLAIHLANALLLWALLRRFVGEGPALATVLLWTVHPLQTESVTYIYQRAESLTALFGLLTLYGLTRAAESPDQKRWKVLAVSACAIGMTGKQIMAVFPILALLYDWAILSRVSKQPLRQRAPLHLGLMATWGVLFLVLATGRNEVPSNAGFTYREITPWQYARSQPAAILHYLRLAFWPHPLVFHYGWLPVSGWTQIVPPALALSLLLGISVWLLRRHLPAGFLAISFFLLLAPTSSFFPIGDILTEHRMYLPLAALLAGAVLASRKFLRGHPIASISLVATVTLGLTATTLRRNEDYRSAVSLWEDTVAKEPGNHRAQTNLGIAYGNENRPEQAIPHYQEALRLNPCYIPTRDLLAVELVKTGRRKEANEQLKISMALAPAETYSRAKAWARIGAILAQRGNSSEAIPYLEKAVELDPQFSAARKCLEMCRESLKKSR